MGAALVRLAAQHRLFPLDVEAPTLMHKVAPSSIQPLSLIHQLHLKILSWYWLSKLLSLWGLAKKLGPQSEATSWLFLYAPLEWPHETPFDSPPSLHSVMMVDVTPWLLSYIKMAFSGHDNGASIIFLVVVIVADRTCWFETPSRGDSSKRDHRWTTESCRCLYYSSIPRFLYL